MLHLILSIDPRVLFACDIIIKPHNPDKGIRALDILGDTKLFSMMTKHR
jgi:hypothetical protein